MTIFWSCVAFVAWAAIGFLAAQWAEEAAKQEHDYVSLRPEDYALACLFWPFVLVGAAITFVYERWLKKERS